MYRHSRPIACSDIAVFREIADAGLQLFDPRSVIQIGDALGRAVDLPEVDAHTYARGLQRYTRPAVAAEVVAASAAATRSAASGRRPVVIVGADPGHGVGPGYWMQLAAMPNCRG